MEQELRSELAAGHSLYGLPVRTLARRQDNDDVLFQIEDGTGRVAEVHLAWAAKPDRMPFPLSGIYESLEVWATEPMLQSHKEFHGE